ncbi:protein boule-like isoform X2 [Ctenocephalides felis]|uniref:protein boule-like isoform X2 n=1 Tax=Ctenocephalides felis TaxID=7515 RepID=UPI000E6E5285|nr:protein boule-like isoform X2 [Ctenocephalides felis]XP_026474192.1 protein boule-like isoform X2 [Ctenocephalides felis]
MSLSPTDFPSAASPMTNCSLTSNAPKYGTLVPNRVFVGGIASNTSEEELARLFSSYGNVKSTKIISDRAGVSKGYGFVTFEQENEAKKVLKEGESIFLKDRKLNVAPAIKKQEPVPAVNATSGTLYYNSGMVPAGYNFQGGVLYYNTTMNTPEPPMYPSITPYNPSIPASPYQMLYQCAPPVYVHPNYIQQPYQPLQVGVNNVYYK